MGIERQRIRWNGWGWAAHVDALGPREEIWRWLAQRLGMPALLATPPRPLDDIALAAPALPQDALEEFGKLLGADRVRQDPYERAFHALGRSYHDLLRLRSGAIPAVPDAVLYPRGESEVLGVLKFAAAHDIAVIPFGGGTGAVGGVSAGRGGFASAITLDMSGMDRVIAIDPASSIAEAECGIYGPALEQQLAAKGVTLGHVPRSFEFSSLGGWIAHHSAGAEQARYGRARDWLAGVRVATPEGLLVSGDAPASAAGPDIASMIIGSEGALGVITQARLRVRPLPAHQDDRAWLLHDFASGLSVVKEAAHMGLPHAMLRLSDADETQFLQAFRALEAKKGVKARLADAVRDIRRFDDKACLLIAGFAGSRRESDAARHRFATIARQRNALALGSSPAKLWREEQFLAPYWRDALLDRGVGVDTLETATGWTKLPALYQAVKTALEQAMQGNAPRPGAHGLVLSHVSHATPDGASISFTIVFPRTLDHETGQWQAIKRAGTEAILAAGGTLSHRHGVGEDHLPWIERERGALTLQALRGFKRAVDPKGILNPGKLLPS